MYSYIFFKINVTFLQCCQQIYTSHLHSQARWYAVALCKPVHTL